VVTASLLGNTLPHAIPLAADKKHPVKLAFFLGLGAIITQDDASRLF